MRILITVLFLVSFGSVSIAGVGDVYYCTTDQGIYINHHKTNRVEPGKFTFKITESHIRFAKAQVFETGKHGFLIVYSANGHDNVKTINSEGGAVKVFYFEYPIFGVTFTTHQLISAVYHFDSPLETVGLMIMSDGDNTRSSFTSEIQNLMIESSAGTK